MKNYNGEFDKLDVPYPQRDKIRTEVEREYLGIAHTYTSVDELNRAISEEVSRRCTEQRDKYQDAINKRDAKFRQQVLEDFGLNHLPQDIQDNAFSCAWQFGHHYGYNEVASYLGEIADLVIAAYEAGKNNKN